MTTTPNDLIHSFQATDRFDGNYSGLTKREYFALCIYAGLMSSTFIHTEYVTVKDAVERADSLIEELNKIAEDITQPEEWIPVRGEKVLVKVKGKWHNESPKFYEDVDYVVNDALVEFRKAEKEGKQIQRLIIPNWVNITIDKIPPMEGGCIAGFRIKPEELKYKVGDKVITKGYSDDYDGKVLTINQIDYDMYCYFDEANNKTDNFRIIQIERFATEEEIRAASIDWSVVNDTEWFYVKTKNEWIIHRCFVYNGCLIAIDVFSITQNISKGFKISIDKNDIKELRLATEQEKQMVFDKYPELKPVEA